jgi:regulator of protease activity HflC (stomatin/prohibitin superfamily)
MNPRGNATEDRDFRSLSGYLALAVVILLLGAGLGLIFEALAWGLQAPGIALLLLGAFFAKGLYMLQPNQAALMLLFGDYRGTDYTTGLRWANPFLSKQKISLRLRNFNSERLKVNDRRGNPIEIAAAVVWRVRDPARAMLDVDHYEAYVPIQAEAAIRFLASEHGYDTGDDRPDELTLRGGGDEIILRLKRELHARFDKAGLAVEDARITHLAYAPEIAGAMLRRQQAEAVIAARRQIVQGAVSMVEMALAGLKERGVVELDDERRAAMVSNLLVVLCGERDAQPVINAGTLYQ